MSSGESRVTNCEYAGTERQFQVCTVISADLKYSEDCSCQRDDLDAIFEFGSIVTAVLSSWNIIGGYLFLEATLGSIGAMIY